MKAERLWCYDDNNQMLDYVTVEEAERLEAEIEGLEAIVAGKSQATDTDLRERLGRRVREVLILWAKRQAAPKPSWLIPWEMLRELEREIDRCIGAALWGDFVAEYAEAIATFAVKQIAAAEAATKGGDA
jgi:hypothetical protein